MEDKRETTTEASAGDVEALFVDPKHVAQVLGVSTRSVTRMCKAGQLPAVRIRNVWRINKARFEQAMGLD